jgi:hypothetical protein
MYKALLSTVIACIILSGCRKESNQEPKEGEKGYFNFGVYSEWPGSALYLFKIEDEKIYRDSMTTFNPFYPPVFESAPMHDSVYQFAKTLPDSLPGYLSSSIDSVYGCPGCSDGLIIYVAVKNSSIERKWLLDGSGRNGLPIEIRPFAIALWNLVYKIRYY